MNNENIRLLSSQMHLLENAGKKVSTKEDVASRIVELCEMFPSLKYDYNTLIATYWLMVDRITTIAEVSKATSAETITRKFRQMVATGNITLSEDGKKSRRAKQEVN